jgi:hypothetical protein
LCAKSRRTATQQAKANGNNIAKAFLEIGLHIRGVSKGDEDDDQDTHTMLATAATIGIGMIAVPSNASAQVLHNSHARAQISRSYRHPEGQIYERGFSGARTPDQAARQDFQTDGNFQ